MFPVYGVTHVPGCSLCLQVEFGKAAIALVEPGQHKLLQRNGQGHLVLRRKADSVHYGVSCGERISNSTRDGLNRDPAVLSWKDRRRRSTFVYGTEMLPDAPTTPIALSHVPELGI